MKTEISTQKYLNLVLASLDLQKSQISKQLQIFGQKYFKKKIVKMPKVVVFAKKLFLLLFARGSK